MCALKLFYNCGHSLSIFFLKTKVKFFFLNLIESAINALQTPFVSDLLLGVQYYGLGVGNPDNVMVAVGSEREPHSGR